MFHSRVLCTLFSPLFSPTSTTSTFVSTLQHAAITALELGPGGGAPVQEMVTAFQERRVSGYCWHVAVLQ